MLKPTGHTSLRSILSFLILVLVLPVHSFGQMGSKHRVLDQFVEMHQIGSEEAIVDFIKSTYTPHDYRQLDLNKHIAFYQQIIREFGPLNPQIYETVEESETKLIVHLIKETEYISNKRIDPTGILVVEIDVSQEDPRYLSRGLGLGALACSIRKDR